MIGDAELPPYEIATCEELGESYSLFWGGPYSQWANIGFTFEGIEFSRAEKFMMFCKAVLFRDGAKAVEIMATNDARKQKALGRAVSGFVQAVWADIAWDIVYVGSYCKFTQNPGVKDYLMGDPADIIVEASPHDAIWGIKLAADDPRAHDRRQWMGRNMLGQAITEVRHYLRDPSSHEPGHTASMARVADLVASRAGLPD